MFGKNEIVGQKYFKKIDDDKLIVTSIFFTIQGEDPFRGYPSVFVRLSKCNLSCFFCDTFFDKGDLLSFSEIDEKITDTINTYFQTQFLDVPEWAKNREMVLVITGGEPMLQSNIGHFLETVGSTFKYTQIESNGTILQNIPDSTCLVVSPKCLEKNNIAIKYLTIKDDVLNRADCLKFVMSADKNTPYNSVPDYVKDWSIKNNKLVFISPMNVYNTEPEKSKLLRMNNNDISLDVRSTTDEIISFWEKGLLNLEANKNNHEYTAK